MNLNASLRSLPRRPPRRRGAGVRRPRHSPSAKSTHRSNRLAHLLAHRGLKPGDRLCVYLANCVEMIDLYLACVKLGVIFVPINILYRDREITHILHDAEPVAVVAAEPFASPVPLWTLAELTAQSAAMPADPPRDPARWRHSRRHHLHFRHHRRVQRRGPHPQQLRRQRHQPARLLADHRRRPLPARPAAVPRPRASATACTAGWSAAAACACWSASSIQSRRRPSSISARRSSSAYPPSTSACSISRPTPRAEIGSRHAPVRLRIGAAARAGPGRIPRALRPHHPGALRHERERS